MHSATQAKCALGRLVIGMDDYEKESLMASPKADEDDEDEDEDDTEEDDFDEDEDEGEEF